MSPQRAQDYTILTLVPKSLITITLRNVLWAQSAHLA